jgi:DnaJ-class molecular chaperone
MSEDFYETLGVDKDADLKKIKGAYRKKAKALHPDISTSKSGAEEFLKLEKAYEVLSDNMKRRRYDEEIDRERSLTGDFRTHYSDPIIEKISPRDSSFDAILRSWFDEGPIQHYRIILSPVEAAAGVVCPLTYTAQSLCPRCEGRTFFDVFLCPLCRGAGVLQREREFVLQIPSGVRHGTSLRITSDGAVLSVEILISSG